MHKSKAENVVSLIYTEERQDSFILAMEYCNGGDLQELLKIKTKFSQQEVQKLVMQTIRGML